jgi:hypothetical protein
MGKEKGKRKKEKGKRKKEKGKRKKAKRSGQFLFFIFHFLFDIAIKLPFGLFNTLQ